MLGTIRTNENFHNSNFNNNLDPNNLNQNIQISYRLQARLEISSNRNKFSKLFARISAATVKLLTFHILEMNCN